jgi:hypothetical protein
MPTHLRITAYFYGFAHSAQIHLLWVIRIHLHHFYLNLYFIQSVGFSFTITHHTSTASVSPPNTMTMLTHMCLEARFSDFTFFHLSDPSEFSGVSIITYLNILWRIVLPVFSFRLWCQSAGPAFSLNQGSFSNCNISRLIQPDVAFISLSLLTSHRHSFDTDHLSAVQATACYFQLNIRLQIIQVE